MNNFAFKNKTYQVKVNGVNQNYGKGQIIFTDYNLIQTNQAFSNLSDTDVDILCKSRVIG